MKHTIDELMMQRCVDGELSDHERAELLSKLHEQGSEENWKSLALTFVEHQVFSKVFADDPGSGEMLSFQLARPSAPGTQVIATEGTSQVPWLHRRVRPWFSIAASLTVGMLVGVGGHFWMGSHKDADDQMANLLSSQPEQVRNAMVPIGFSPTGQNASQAPVMNVHLTGLGNHSEPVSVPVYAPDQWQAIQQFQSSPPLPEHVRQLLESRGMTVDRERQWYRARLQDGREILVPTEIMRVRHTVQ